MIVKRIKIILFAFLTDVMARPFFMADISATQIVENGDSENELSYYVLLEKDDRGNQKYASSVEFDKIDKLICTYVNDTHSSNPRNEEIKKNEIKIYNFDAMVEKREVDLHTLLVNVAERKANETYESTDAKQKFHKCASKKIHNFIKLDVDGKLIKQVIKAYNTNINHVCVPFDLLNSDTEFCGKVMTDTTCNIYVECISDAAIDNIDDPGCTIIPYANAHCQSAHHYLSISVEPYSCYEETGCMYANFTTGTGTLKVSLRGDKHTSTPTLKHTANLVSGENVHVASTDMLTARWTGDDIEPISGIVSAHVNDYNIKAEPAVASTVAHIVSRQNLIRTLYIRIL